MPNPSQAAKLYKEFVKTLAKKVGKSPKEALPLTQGVKGAMREFKPEAFEKLQRVRPLTAEEMLKLGRPAESVGTTQGSLMDLRIDPGGLKPLTFGHEMGHHLMYRDPKHPFWKQHNIKPALGERPEEPEISESIEWLAEHFGERVVSRMLTGVRGDKPIGHKGLDELTKWLKMLAVGTGAGMGITDFLGPDEAEAAPRGIYEKVTKAVLSGEVSRAAKDLIGKTMDGKIVKDVRKGVKNFRAIIFDDGTQSTVTNTELNDLCRAYGRQAYGKKFAETGAVEKGLAAEKSLNYHFKRVQPFSTRETIDLFHQKHIERLKEMGAPVTPTSLVTYQGRSFAMPTEYARHLKEKGLLTIIKDYK